MAADEEIRCHGAEEHAVDRDHGRRAGEGGQVAADEAAERHPSAERDHEDAHHAAAHFVGRDQLDERHHGGDHHHQGCARQEQQNLADPHHARLRKRDDQSSVQELPDQHGQAHSLEFSQPRDHERAGDRARARKGEQLAVGPRPFVENSLGKNRQELQHREAQKRRGERQHRERGETAVVADVGEAAAQLVAHARGAGVRDVLHAQHIQRGDHDEKRQRVHEEARCHALHVGESPLRERRNRRAEHEGPQNARDIDLDRIEGDRVGKIFLVFDERRDQGLIRRAAKSLGETGRKRQHENVPDPGDAKIDEQGEHERRRHLEVLRSQQRSPAVEPIGEHTADEREKHDRELLEESVEAEEKCGAGQREDEPVLRRELRPGADARRAGANPLDAEIAMSERRQHPAESARAQQCRRRGEGVGRGDLLDGFGQIVVLTRSAKAARGCNPAVNRSSAGL